MGKRLPLLTLFLAAAGLAVAVAWVRATGVDDVLASMSAVRGARLPVMLAITAASVFGRFVRWQFLLRRVGVRLPTRASLGIYLASLAAIATPAYVGEVIRPVLVRRDFGIPLRVTLPVWVGERLLDVVALGLLGAAAVGPRRAALPLAALALGALAGGLGAARLLAPRLHSGQALARLTRPAVVAPALGVSLLAWAPATLLPALAAASLGHRVGWIDGAAVFCRATLLGGMSLMPAGVGVTGSVLIVELQEGGMALADAVSTVSLVRLTTAGFAVVVGTVFLLLALRGRRLDAQDAGRHFDAIGEEYEDRFAPHIWDLLVSRKTRMIADALPGKAGLGLDLGCGVGHHGRVLRDEGYRIVGLDLSTSSVRRARQAGVPVVEASATRLPFEDRSLDYVYAVGVLHHVEEDDALAATLAEVHRVLRPEGLFLLHETNPRNPLFRFYMGYLFPILKDIDEGTERWLDADGLEIDGLELVDLRYSTFLPDFTPRALMGVLLPLDRRLARGPLGRYAAHYFAAFRKEPR